ncbi:hypothetical protein JCM8202_000481 [Rhodotorula sphaerocarpa]
MARTGDLSALDTAFASSLEGATSAAQAELRRLASFRAPVPTINYPNQRLAAVLVLLHLNLNGELSLREAHEEIGLPLPNQGSSAAPLLYLTTLPAYSSRTLLVVLPVVYLLLQPAATASTSCLSSFLRPNPDEVDAIFHLPLRSFLMLPSGEKPREDDLSHAGNGRIGGTAAAASEEEPPLSYSYQDFTWLCSRPYRLHAFSATAPTSANANTSVAHSAVTGLTADIVLDTALIATYGTTDESELPPRAVGFERKAPDQMAWSEIVREALATDTKGSRSKSGGASREKGLGAKLDSGRTPATDNRTNAT